MIRSKAERILERILAKLDSGEMPLRVAECYVFGSYAAGAAEPGDLDLILVHDAVPFSDPWWEMPNPPVVLGKALRKPGEKIDILTGTSLSAVLDRFGKVASSTRILLWSEQERNWRERLAAIPVIEGVTRHERNHFANLKRFHGTAVRMECVTEAIKEGFLSLERIDLANCIPKLNPLYRRWFDWWESIRCVGRDTTQTLEYGMWWMQTQKGQSNKRPDLGRCELSSTDGRYRVYLGRPPLRAISEFSEPDCLRRKIGLIPHFKRDLPKEILVFETGKKWDRAKFVDFEEQFRTAFRRQPSLLGGAGGVE